MRYVESRLIEYDRGETYRIYVARSLQLIPQNQYMTKTYYDIIKQPQKQDLRTGDEIAADVMKNAGLSFGG